MPTKESDKVETPTPVATPTPPVKKKWYENKVYVILWLIFFFPVGIYGVWKTGGWSKRTRWILTALPAIFIVWSMITASMAAPVITTSGYTANQEVDSQDYKVAGQVLPAGSKLKVNGVDVKVETDGKFAYTLKLKDGQNEIIISATNSGKTVEVKETVKKLTAEEVSKRKAEADANAKANADKKAQEDAQKAEATKELDATIKFNAIAFMITNKEAVNWTNCKFVLNGKLFGSDFTYKTSMGIPANDTVIVSMSDFTKSDGTMFNPYTTKPKNLFLSCDAGANHRTGYYAISE